MPGSSKTLFRQTLEIIVAFVPWVIAMYVFYWLETSGTWTSDTPHRGKMSVALLATGMALSFLAKSRFDKRST